MAVIAGDRAELSPSCPVFVRMIPAIRVICDPVGLQRRDERATVNLMWHIVVASNLLMAACYGVIAALITQGLVRTGQLFTNPLALATAAIFTTCALHHGGHGLHILLPLGQNAMHMSTVRDMFGSWPHVAIDLLGVAVAVIYLGLRRNFKALLKTPSMFTDAADVRCRQLAASLSHTSVLAVDHELRYVLAEGSALSAFGGGTEQRVGKLAYDVVSPSVWEEVGPHYRAALHGETNAFDTAGTDGETLHVQTAPMWNEAGDAVGGALIVIQDVTEERTAATKLREAMAFNQAVLSASPDIMTVVDQSTGSTVWESRSMWEALGGHPGTSVATDLDLRSRVVGEDLRHLEIADAQLASLPDGASLTTRFRVNGPDGQQRWIARNGTPFGRDEAGALLRSVCVLRDVTDIVAVEERLQHAALHDPLTGLPNRALLVDVISAAMQRNQDNAEDLVLLFCDVDGFKHINDVHGHAAGDAVLIEIARRLRHVLRQGDSVARVGGDEFVAVLEPPRDADGARKPATVSPTEAARSLAERIRREVAKPIIYHGGEVFVSLSIGLTHSRPSTSPAEALRDADTAMYRAKQGGRNRVAVYGDNEARIATADAAVLASRDAQAAARSAADTAVAAHGAEVAALDVVSAARTVTADAVAAAALESAEIAARAATGVKAEAAIRAMDVAASAVIALETVAGELSDAVDPDVSKRIAASVAAVVAADVITQAKLTADAAARVAEAVALAAEAAALAALAAAVRVEGAAGTARLSAQSVAGSSAEAEVASDVSAESVARVAELAMRRVAWLRQTSLEETHS